MQTDKKNTKGQLLRAACEVFAQKGYRDATVAEICEKAGANIAAVNYYFGDKEKLYIESWRLSFQRSLEKYPADGGVGPDAPARQRLEGRIFSILRRFSDPEIYEFDMMQKEMVQPTGLLGEVIHNAIEPLRRELTYIIRELLGDGATEKHILLCLMSIRAQCYNLMVYERHRKFFQNAGMQCGPMDMKLTIEDIAGHITRFSLAGIHDIRKEIESGKTL